MTDQQPDARPGGARPERGPVAELARLFLVQLAAVIGIATAIVVVVALVGPSGDDDQITAVAPGSSDSGSTSPAPSAAKSTPSAPPESSASPPSTPAATTSTPPPSTSSAPEQVEVDVLNQSAGSGAAADVADRLREKGWEIGRVDDFRGNVSTTTVYWLTEEERRQARRIARFLGDVRVQEGFDTLVDGRISVVLVDSEPDTESDDD